MSSADGNSSDSDYDEQEEDDEEEEDFVSSRDDTTLDDDEQFKVFTNEDLLTEINQEKQPQAPSSGPARATRLARDPTRTTFICFNEEAFKAQLKKEESQSDSLSDMTLEAPTEAATNSLGPTKGRQRTGRDQQNTRTTFICLNQGSFLQQMQREEQLQLEAEQSAKNNNDNNNKPAPVTAPPTVPPRGAPPRPPRPTRSPTVDAPPSNSPLGPRFGAAPPARPAESSAKLNTSEAGIRRGSKTVEPTPTDTKMPQVYHELVNTERDYIRDLEIIVKVFLNPIRAKHLLSHYEIVSLFCNIEELIPVNKNLYADINELQSCQTVGEIFQKHAASFLKCYTIYCSNQPNIHELLIQYKSNNQEFADFLKQNLRNKECRKQDLESFLIMPLQRLCKYPLLLKELVAFEQRAMIAEAAGKDRTEDDNGICVWGLETGPQVQMMEQVQYWTGVACGALHYAAVSFGTSVYVWGKGREGQLGLGPDAIQRDEPTLVPIYSDTSCPLKVKQVFCGPSQTAIITDTNDLYLWGLLREPVYEPTLQLFNGLQRQVNFVDFGPTSIYAIVESPKGETGEVWSWGESSKGMLGLGPVKTRTETPCLIDALKWKDVIQLSAGEQHVACLTRDGKVFLWGENSDDVLQLGQRSNIFTPLPFSQLDDSQIIQVECGFKHTFALSQSGAVYAWGYSRHGVLGIPQPKLSISVSSTEGENQPLQEITLLQGKKIKKLVSGGMHCFALAADGRLYSWGEGRGFKTCQETENDILVPTLVRQLVRYDVQQIDTSHSRSAAFFEAFNDSRCSIVSLDEGLNNFRSVVMQINNQVRQVENITYLLQVVNKIDSGHNLHLVNPKRTVEKEGAFVVNKRKRYGFLFNDILLLCKMPSRSAEEKLYRPVRRIVIADSKLADLPDATDPDDRYKYRLEIQYNLREYVIQFKKKDFKLAWQRSLKSVNTPLAAAPKTITQPAPPVTNRRSSQKVVKGAPLKKKGGSNIQNIAPASDPRKLSSTTPLNTKHATTREKSQTNSNGNSKDAQMETKAVALLLASLQKELQEEEQARAMAEQHNSAMSGLLTEQNKLYEKNLMDESSIKEFERRIESLSSLVDKLTEENVLLKNQLSSKKNALVPMLNAAGLKLAQFDNDLSESEDEDDDDPFDDE